MKIDDKRGSREVGKLGSWEAGKSSFVVVVAVAVWCESRHARAVGV